MGTTLDPTAAAALASRFFAAAVATATTTTTTTTAPAPASSSTTSGAAAPRLTVSADVLNPDTCSLPGWILRYAGGSAPLSPASCKTHAFKAVTRTGARCDVVECDVDLRKWSLLARQASNTVLPNLAKVDFQVSLRLRGEAPRAGEFPERVLCGARLSWLDTARAATW